jgi:multidrug efflux pump subunit AcrB
MSSAPYSRDEQLRRVKTAIEDKRNWLHANQSALQDKARDNPFLKPVAKQYSALRNEEEDIRTRQLQMMERLVQHLNELENSDDAKTPSIRVNLKRDKRDLEREMERLREKRT